MEPEQLTAKAKRKIEVLEAFLELGDVEGALEAGIEMSFIAARLAWSLFLLNEKMKEEIKQNEEEGEAEEEEEE